MPAKGNGPGKLQPHPLIEKLTGQGAGRGGADQSPNVQALTGYLARDPQPDYWRIYQDLNLNAFYRVAADDIVGSQDLATEEEPLRPTIVWVRQGATIEQTRIASRQVQAASFLQGTMMSGYMRGGRGARMAGLRTRGTRPGRGAEYGASVDWCESVDFCRTPDYGACFTRPAYCRSEFGACPTDFCQSDFACPTDVFCDTYDYQLC
jgi:hypothetical protein